MQPRINIVFIALTLFDRGLAAPNPGHPTEAKLESRSNFEETFDQASACYCVGAHQGQYCGYCDQVRGSDTVDNWVYECNGGGGCSAYGFRYSCDAWEGPCG
ncbi:hypothetical protein GQ53DRAFT_823495 [Thozetella sp. PMI_491]|nr:hypothetical protein GQ53DRAFT_823495 [Thozetella sp. PMI_491]